MNKETTQPRVLHAIWPLKAHITLTKLVKKIYKQRNKERKNYPILKRDKFYNNKKYE